METLVTSTLGAACIGSMLILSINQKSYHSIMSFLMILLIASLVLINIIFLAVAVYYCWSWFVVPFFQVPELTLLQAYGLASFRKLTIYRAIYLASHKQVTKYHAGQYIAEKFRQDFQTGIFKPMFVLFIAYLIHLFI